MDVFEFAIFVAYIVLSLVTGLVAARRGGSGPRWFLLALVCTPVMGLFLVFLLADEEPSGVYRPSGGRASWAAWLLAVSAGLLAATAIVAGATATGTAGVRDALTTPRAVLGSLDVLVSIAAAIAFLAWLSRVVDNVASAGLAATGVTPRWSIAWWFIPIANLGMPYEVVRSVLVGLAGRESRRQPGLLVAWWFLFLAGLLVLYVAAGVAGLELAGPEITVGMAAIGSGLLAAAGVMAVVVIRSTERAAGAHPQARDAFVGIDSAAWLAASTHPIPKTRLQGLEGVRMRPSWVGFVSVTLVFATYVATVVMAWSLGAAPSAASGGQPGSMMPHQDAGLEAILPDYVGGKSLTAWSYRGAAYFTDVVGMTEADVTAARAELAQIGIDLDNIGFAVAGRSSVDDPPYFVMAISLAGATAGEMPTEMFIDYPSAGSFTPTLVGGKHVDVGVEAMFDQTEHLRGQPYVYSRGNVRFIVITDDNDWAADALSQLP